MEKADIIKTLVELFANTLVSDPTVAVTQQENIFHIQINAGEEAPNLIGRHGDTIRCLQKVIEVALFKKFQERIDIVVNVNDYREKQIERLQSIASEIAHKVLNDTHSMPFRGLNSYERRIVHEHITNSYPDLTTYSEGQGFHRTLYIDLKSSGQSGYNEDHVDQNN